MSNVHKLLVANLVLATSLFLMPLAHADNTPPTDAIIAIVNDDVITLKDLRQYIASVASQLRLENKTSQEVQKIMEGYEQEGLDKLIDDKLILAAAKEKGIIIRDDIIDKRLKDIKSRYSTEDEFFKAIGAEGLTVSDLKQKLTDQMMAKYEVDMEVKDKIFINPQQVTEYYNVHKTDYYQKPKVNLQSIFLSYKKHPKQEAQTLAQEARSRLIAGDNFDDVFKKYSDGSSIGEIEQGQMVDSIDNVVFNMKIDEVSDTIEVENGIYVFKVIGVSQAKQQDMIEVKDQIYNKLLDDQFQEKFKTWIDNLRKKAYVEIK